MCGLIGFASTAKLANIGPRRGFLFQGFLDNMQRGDQSTGMALIKLGEEKKQPFVYKAAIDAYDFVHRPQFLKVLANLDDYSLVMGHTRSATRGNGVTDRNAHPFQHGHITLVHNGTMDNAWDLVPHADRPLDVTVDSDIVALAMGRLKEGTPEKEVLERIKGEYTLIWHNSRDGTLNIARNEKRPLYWAYLKGENTMMWTSEETLLWHLLRRRNLTIEGKLQYPGANTWYKFNLQELREYEHLPFAPCQRNTRHGSTEKGTELTKDSEQNSTGTMTKHGKKDKYQPATPEQMCELLGKITADVGEADTTTIKEWLRRRTQMDPNVKHSGLPSTAKKVQEAVKLLQAIGIKFNATGFLRPPLVWIEYRKNKNLGELTGTCSNGMPGVMANVLKKDFKQYVDFEKVIINIVGIRKINSGNKALVCIKSMAHDRTMTAFFQRKADEARGDLPGEPLAPRPYIMGPRNQLITEEKYKELTSIGCVWCGDPLPVHYHANVRWVNEKPVCLHPCFADTEMWVFINANPKDFYPEKIN